MKKTLLIGFFFAILLAILAIQNSADTEIKIYFWQITGAKSIILIFTYIIGILSGIILCIPLMRKKKE